MCKQIPLAIKPPTNWSELVNATLTRPLVDFIEKDYANKKVKVFPPKAQLFDAFTKCPFDELKVVIVGQSPYDTKGQANGLNFSVNEGVSFPPPLYNIFKEIKDDVQVPIPKSGCLERWASQGILLLNVYMSFVKDVHDRHKSKKWEHFTDEIIRYLSNDRKDLVFLLWGSFAERKQRLIDSKKHLVLTSKHPSPMAVNRGGWFGNKHFSKTNAFLKTKGKQEIAW